MGTCGCFEPTAENVVSREFNGDTNLERMDMALVSTIEHLLSLSQKVFI
jgi:hypothetical protein